MTLWQPSCKFRSTRQYWKSTLSPSAPKGQEVRLCKATTQETVFSFQVSPVTKKEHLRTSASRHSLHSILRQIFVSGLDCAPRLFPAAVLHVCCSRRQRELLFIAGSSRNEVADGKSFLSALGTSHDQTENPTKIRRLSSFILASRHDKHQSQSSCTAW